MPRESQPFTFQAPDGFEVGGVRLGGGKDAEAGGGPAAPPLVFTPGNGFPVQIYQEILLPLPGTVWAFNPRGMGSSQAPSSFTDWTAMGEELRAFVEERLEPPVLLGGHSMGAKLSLWLAAQAPHLVAGLLMLDPIVLTRPGRPPMLPPKINGRTIIDVTRTRREQWPSREEAVETLRASRGYRNWSPRAFAAFCEHGLLDDGRGGVRLACPAWLEATIYETVPREVLYEWAGQVRCPVVILRGMTSLESVREFVEELAGTMPIATVMAVKGPHAFPMEFPRETGMAMLAAMRILRGETRGG